MPREMLAGTSWPILEGVVSDANGPVDLTSATTITVYTRLAPASATAYPAVKVTPQTGDDEGRFTADIDPGDFPAGEVGEHEVVVKVQWDALGDDISYFGVDTLTITENPALL